MIRRHRAVAALAALVAGLALAAPSASASSVEVAAARGVPAVVSTSATGSSSSLAYLKAHYGSLDTNWENFSIATRLLVDLNEKSRNGYDTAPLRNAQARLTLFLPTDRALRILLEQVLHRTYTSERQVYRTVALMSGADVDSLLGFGVIRSQNLSAAQVLAAGGRNLATNWRPRTIHVAVYHLLSGPIISLWDQDTRFRNPRVILAKTNLNSRTLQTIHGVDRVLLGFHEKIAPDWFGGGVDSLLYDVGELPSCSAGPLPCAGGTPGHG